MKAEYNFATGERGKFFRPNAGIRLPIYLDADIQDDLAKRAAKDGMSLNAKINWLLKQGIETREPTK